MSYDPKRPASHRLAEKGPGHWSRPQYYSSASYALAVAVNAWG